MRRAKQLLLVVSLVLAKMLEISLGANGGITSSYRRKLEATVDMPLDADVFRPPPGYNAPQQATAYRIFFCAISLAILLLRHLNHKYKSTIKHVTIYSGTRCTT
jgi:hypothetical protein